MNERVLVTGAGGFVCRHIVAALLDAGYRVIALDRAVDADLRAAWADHVELVEADMTALPGIDADLFVHGAALTAEPEQTGQTPAANFNANMLPTLHLLEWAGQRNIRRGVFISSAGVFAPAHEDTLTEADAPAPGSLYGLAKVQTEQIAAFLRRHYHRDYVSIRLGDTYGPGEYLRPTRPRLSLVGQMIQAALTDGVIVSNSQLPARDWTFAPDTGRTVAALLAPPTLRHELYHVTSGQVLAPFQIAERIRALVPGIRVVVDDTPVPPARQRPGHLSGERLHAELNLRDWTDIDDGLRQTIAWQRTQLGVTS